MNKKNRFIKTIFFTLIIIPLTVFFTIMTYCTALQYIVQLSKLKTTKEKYFYDAKKELSSKIDEIVKHINYKIDTADKKSQNIIKDRVYQAYNIIEKTYNTNKNYKTKNQIIEIVKNTLKHIKFNNGRESYFAISLDGTKILFDDTFGLQEKNFINIKSDNDLFIIKDMIEIVSSSEEGYYKYQWAKPDSQLNNHEKITFIKLFKPLNMLIGTGKYTESFKQDVQKEIIEWLETIEPQHEEDEIFAGTYNGLALVGPAKGRNTYEITNSNGVKVVQKLISTAKNGGGFVEYVTPKLGKMRQATKLSYTTNISRWNWYIGTGVYIDRIEEQILISKKNFQTKVTFSILLTLALSLIFTVLLIVISRKITTKIEIEINNLKNSIKLLMQENIKIDTKKIKYREFEDLAIIINKMFDEKSNLEEVLKQTENLLNTLISKSSISIQIFDKNGITIKINSAYEQLWEVTSEEVVGKYSILANKYALNEEWSNYAKKAFEGKIINIDELEYTPISKKDLPGETKILKVMAFPIKDKDNNILNIVMMHEEITDIVQSKSSITYEKEKLFLTLENIRDGIIIVDLNGKIEFINKSGETLIGWRQKEVKGKIIYDFLDIVYKKDKKKVKNFLETAITYGSVINTEIMITPKHNKDILISIKYAAIRNKYNKIKDVILILNNMEEMKDFQEELISKQNIESIGRLAEGIAHDFNNLLTGILGNVSTALSLQDKKSKIYKNLEMAKTSCLQAEELTNKLFIFSKEQKIITKAASINEIITNSVELTLYGSAVDYNINITDTLWQVDADSKHLTQALNNIIENAKESMNNKGIIDISASNISLPYGNYVEIKITDSGNGINQNNINKIFEPYFTTKPSQSGLGLTVANAIIEKHNGVIKVVSEIQHGTTVSIRIPAKKNLKEQDKENITHSGNILIMDDDEIVRETVKSMLEMIGYQVKTAKNGEEAIAMYKENNFKLIIMDLTIVGGMSGKDAIRKLLEIDPEITAIISSGYSSDPIMANYKNYGFKGTIIKPYTLEKLEKEIENVLTK